MNINAAINDLIARINEILDEEEYSDYLMERLFRMKEQLVLPSVQALESGPNAAAADRVSALYAATEEYVVYFQSEPEHRETRRQKVEGLKRLVRRTLLGEGDNEGELEQLLDDIRRWQWKTTLDDKGRLVYATGTGTVVPARGVIAGKVGPQVIRQAVKAQRPYADRIRPRDIHGEPGALLIIEDASRLIVVGDLHGRYDNLEHILRDKNNLQDILSGKAHLVFTGDAIHPRSSAMSSPEAYEDSFCVMLLIMTLKAENPFNVHYLIGNHDNAHVGGMPAGRGQVRQDTLFEKFVVEKFGAEVFKDYQQFVGNSTVAAKVRASNGYLLLVHAGLTPRVLNEQGLINMFVRGRQGYELQELLWSRNYRRETLQTCLKNVGAKFIVAGHTAPKLSKAHRYGLDVLVDNVFGHVHHLQIVLNAQGNIFGYLDVDLTRPLPEDVTDLCAPGGKPAYRVLRPKTLAAHKSPPAGAAGSSSGSHS